MSSTPHQQDLNSNINSTPQNEQQAYDQQSENLQVQILPEQKQETQEPFVSEQKKKRLARQKKKELLYSHRRIKKILKDKPINHVRVLYQLYFFLMSITVLTLSVLSYKEQRVYEEDYYQLLDNWKQDAIEDIQFTHTDKDCQSSFGNDYSPLFTYEWPGTQIGCDCSKNVNLNSVSSTPQTINEFFSKVFMIGRVCSTDLQKQNCVTVDEEFAKLFTSWNDGTFGKPFVLCAKRLKNINYQTQKYYCEEKTCGTGDKIFCVKKNQTCPITEMGFTTEGNYDNILQLNDKNYGEIFDLGRSFYFYVKRNTESLPVSEIRVTEGDGVCARNAETNISPNRIDYPLLVSRRTACNVTDESFKLLNKINEEQFYLSNNVIYFSDVLPYFHINTEYKWGIYERSYIEWSPKCSRSLFEQVIETGESLTEVYIALRAQLGVTIAYFVVVGILLNIIGTMTACNFAWSCMITHPDSQYNVVFMTEIIIKTVMQIGEIIVIIISFYVLNKKRQVSQDVVDYNCLTDPLSNQFFDKFSNDLTEYTWSYNLAILVIFAFTFLIDFLIIKYSINTGEMKGAKHHHEEANKTKQTLNFRRSIHLQKQ